jgi:hypothetical protein
MESPPAHGRSFWLKLIPQPTGFDQPAFLYLLVICQAATILLTWPLWQVHRAPPMIPAVRLPEVNTGVVLLITLAAIIFRPLPALILHTALVVYSILIDQTRLQPEIVSLVILMWGAHGSFSLKTMARAHLVSLWFFAGANKLLSSNYMSSVSFMSYPRSSLRVLMVPLIEIALALLALIPRTRKVAAALGLLFHLTIFAFMLIRPNRNSAIWFWNLGLAFAGFALIYPWQDSIIATARKSKPVASIAALLILVSPIGFYFGLMDAYLAHNLYTLNLPSAYWVDLNGTPRGIDTMPALNVPIPAEHRIFEGYFKASCKPGEYLVIQDPRYWAKLKGYEVRRIECVP